MEDIMEHFDFEAMNEWDRELQKQWDELEKEEEQKKRRII